MTQKSIPELAGNHPCPTQSRPEAFTAWLLHCLSSMRELFGLFIIVGLTLISAIFNYQLGKIIATDSISRALMPVGFALLDAGCLFLAGYVGIKSHSPLRKVFAWLWFIFLLALSLWACASFTMAQDALSGQASTDRLIEAKVSDLEATQQQIQAWNDKLSATTRHSSAYQEKLDNLSARRDKIQAKLTGLNADNPPPGLSIYYKTAPLLPWSIEPDQLAGVVRFLWSGALVITPLMLALLVTGGHRPITKQTRSTVNQTASQSTAPTLLKLVPKSAPIATPNAPKPIAVPIPGSGAAGGALPLDRFEEVAEQIRSGALPPSTRALKRIGISSDLAGQILRRLVKGGIITRRRQGYCLIDWKEQVCFSVKEN